VAECVRAAIRDGEPLADTGPDRTGPTPVPPLAISPGPLTTATVYIALGGVGFTGHAESVAELRAHAASLRGVKPLPSWLFSVLDNLEAQEAEHPTEYSHLSICEAHDIHTWRTKLTEEPSGDALGQVSRTHFRPSI
jgi:hypothetical protein